MPEENPAHRFLRLWDGGDVIAEHQGRQLRYMDLSYMDDELTALRAQVAKAEAPRSWLLTAVGESMTHTGPFHEAAELAERSWIARYGRPEGALVWSRGDDDVWSLLHQESDGGLMPTQIKVRAR